MSELVTIVGSYNVGIFLKSSKLPKPGETILADNYFEGPGGKGSNQALTVNKLGAKTIFIGKLGKDKYGEDALKLYESSGVNTSNIFIEEGSHTGVSVILINSQGENIISVSLGANEELSASDLDNCEKVFRDSKIIGFQLENKLETVIHGVNLSKNNSSLTFLDPAPAQVLPDQIYNNLDFIKPNETETEILTGIKVENNEDAIEAGEWFISKGVKNAIITMGKKGVVWVSKETKRFYESLNVIEKDTTGAGDIFAGSFLKSFVETNNVDKSIHYAVVAASLSVEKEGVVESIPSQQHINNFL